MNSRTSKKVKHLGVGNSWIVDFGIFPLGIYKYLQFSNNLFESNETVWPQWIFLLNVYSHWKILDSFLLHWFWVGYQINVFGKLQVPQNDPDGDEFLSSVGSRFENVKKIRIIF